MAGFWSAQVYKAGELSRSFWQWIGPGGQLHPQVFLERYHGHIVIESLLAVVIIYLFFQRSFKWSSKKPKPLTEEVRKLCAATRTSLPAYLAFLGSQVGGRIV